MSPEYGDWWWSSEPMSYEDACILLGMGTERSERSVQDEGDVRFTTIEGLIGDAVYAPRRSIMRRLLDRLRGGAR